MKEYDPIPRLRSLRNLINALDQCEKEEDEKTAVEIMHTYITYYEREMDIPVSGMTVETLKKILEMQLSPEQARFILRCLP